MISAHSEEIIGQPSNGTKDGDDNRDDEHEDENEAPIREVDDEDERDEK
jgi:hypothetical protein